MATNNPSLLNAALAGFMASRQAWLTSQNAADYAGLLASATAFATEVDSKIAAIVGGATTAQNQLMQTVVQAVVSGRAIKDTTAADFSDIALVIKAIFTELSGGIDGSAGSGQLLTFDVADDSGVVASQTTVTHLVAVAGILATDIVIGLNMPAAAAGSGLNVIAAVNAGGQIALNYNNPLAIGSTNGPTTYKVTIKR